MVDAVEANRAFNAAIELFQKAREEAIDALRELREERESAKSRDAFRRSLVKNITGGVTLDEAVRRIKEIAPAGARTYASIDLKLTEHHDGETKVEWDVYLSLMGTGPTFRGTGSTLDAALADFVSGTVRRPSGADVDAALTPVAGSNAEAIPIADEPF